METGLYYPKYWEFVFMILTCLNWTSWGMKNYSVGELQWQVCHPCITTTLFPIVTDPWNFRHRFVRNYWQLQHALFACVFPFLPHLTSPISSRISCLGLTRLCPGERQTRRELLGPFGTRGRNPGREVLVLILHGYQIRLTMTCKFIQCSIHRCIVYMPAYTASHPRYLRPLHSWVHSLRSCCRPSENSAWNHGQHRIRTGSRLSWTFNGLIEGGMGRKAPYLVGNPMKIHGLFQMFP